MNLNRKYHSDHLKDDNITHSDVHENGYGINYYNAENHCQSYSVEFWPFYVRKIAENVYVPDFTKTNITHQEDVLKNGSDFTLSLQALTKLKALIQLKISQKKSLIDIYKELYSAGVISIFENLVHQEDYAHLESFKDTQKPAFDQFNTTIEEYKATL